MAARSLHRPAGGPLLDPGALHSVDAAAPDGKREPYGAWPMCAPYRAWPMCAGIGFSTSIRSVLIVHSLIRFSGLAFEAGLPR